MLEFNLFNGVLNTDDNDKEETLNKWFESVCIPIKENTPPLPKPQYQQTSHLKEIGNKMVNSASGPDNLANRVLKH